MDTITKLPDSNLPVQAKLDGDTQVADYRQVSIPAIITLLFGVLTLLAFFSPSLLVFAFLTLLCAIWTWIQTSKQPGIWTGTRWAKWGLACALLASGFVVVHEFTQRNWLAQSATRVAEQWLTYNRDGNVESAYELTRPTNERFFNKELLQKRLEQVPDAKTAYERYLEREPIKQIIASGKDLRWKLVKSTARVSSNSQESFYYVYYLATVTENGKSENIPVSISIGRNTAGKDGPVWTVVTITKEAPDSEIKHKDE